MAGSCWAAEAPVNRCSDPDLATRTTDARRAARACALVGDGLLQQGPGRARRIAAGRALQADSGGGSAAPPGRDAPERHLQCGGAAGHRPPSKRLASGPRQCPRAERRSLIERAPVQRHLGPVRPDSVVCHRPATLPRDGQTRRRSEARYSAPSGLSPRRQLLRFSRSRRHRDASYPGRWLTAKRVLPSW